MAIATLTIDINTKLANLERDMGKAAHVAEQNAKRIENSFKQSGKALETLGKDIAAAFSVSLFVGMIKNSIDMQDRLNDLSKSTKISVEDLSGLSLAAKQSGANLEDTAAAINKLSVNFGKDPEKFRKLGIDAKEPLERFKQLADVFVRLDDDERQAAVAAESLGKSWAGAAPLLAEGSKAIGEMIAKGRELSKVTKEDAEAADKLNDQLEELSAVSQSVKNSFANILVPSLTETAKAMQNLVQEGNPFLALLRGFAGLGKIPLDIAFPGPKFTAEEQINDLKKKLSGLESDFAKSTATGGGLINNLVFGKPDELARQIEITKNQIDALVKFGKRSDFYTGVGDKNPKPLQNNSGLDVDGFLNGDPKKPKTPKAKAAKEDKYTDLLTPAAEAYAKALESINTAINNAEKSTLNLDAAQETLHDLMKSPVWQDMPESWKELVTAQVEAGSAAIKTAEDYKRLKDLLDATPTAKLEEARDQMLFLADAFETGKISAEQFSEAAMTALGNIPDSAKEAADAMDEFALQAARNIQDAFADFLFDPFKDGVDGMLKGFGDVVKRMIANAVAADLGKRLFGTLSGGEGDGLVGGGLKWLSGLIGNAKGGAYASPGLSAYSGSIVSRPTLFPFASGMGLMGESGAEAILPLKRGTDGKLGVSAGGGSNVINLYYNGTNSQEMRKSAGAVSRDVLSAISGAGRYR